MSTHEETLNASLKKWRRIGIISLVINGIYTAVGLALGYLVYSVNSITM